MAQNKTAGTKPPETGSDWIKINPPVFFGSAGIILAFVAFGASMPDFAGEVFSSVQSWIVETFGWFYLLAVAGFLIFVIALAVSGYGQIKLGPDDSEPEFRYPSWIAMLFSAGMGIGLMFFGVAEPLIHYTSPPAGEGGTIAAVREAMEITFFHWGIHAWAIYAVVGLSLAYFSFRHDLPLTIRSALYPLIGERIYGPIGHAVDVFAVLGTMFGVATSLGLGVLQINAGLDRLFGIPEAVSVQLLLIAIITLIATGSVVAGLDAGIRRISELNLLLAISLVGFVLVVGPTLFLIQAMLQNTGDYLSDLVSKTFSLYLYEPTYDPATGWIGGWTLFYWAWWIAWSPFVGMFIARISRGRTVRQFVFGVLLIPVGFTAIWMTVFGNTAIDLDMTVAAGALGKAAESNVATALFRFFEYLPLSFLTSLIATALVVTFFVTSSDSGSLVIDTITSGGREEAPTWQRVFWAIKEGAVAAVLLLAGGLSALQTAAITSALPFTFVMILIAWGLLQGLRKDALRQSSLQRAPATLAAGPATPWQQRLAAIVSYPRRDRAIAFLNNVVRPALEDVGQEIRKRGLDVNVTRDDDSVSMQVHHAEEQDFVYGVHLHGYASPNFAFPEMPRRREGNARYWRAEVHLREGNQRYDLVGCTRDQVITDVLSQYERHVHFLNLVR